MPTTTYTHFRDVPESAWRWPSFSPAEIACRGTGAIKINTEAMDKLQSLRNRLGKPLIVRSAYRSPSHNRAVGGAPASKHMLAQSAGPAAGVLARVPSRGLAIPRQTEDHLTLAAPVEPGVHLRQAYGGDQQTGDTAHVAAQLCHASA